MKETLVVRTRRTSLYIRYSWYLLHGIFLQFYRGCIYYIHEVMLICRYYVCCVKWERSSVGTENGFISNLLRLQNIV